MLKDASQLASAAANRPNDGFLTPRDSGSPSSCKCILSTRSATAAQKPVSSHLLYLRRLLPLELLLRARPVRVIFAERVSAPLWIGPTAYSAPRTERGRFPSCSGNMPRPIDAGAVSTSLWLVSRFWSPVRWRFGARKWSGAANGIT